MSKIKCHENYKVLREMLLNGEKGDAEYFSNKLGISSRSFYRLIKYLKDIENMEVSFDKYNGVYSYLPPPCLE